MTQQSQVCDRPTIDIFFHHAPPMVEQYLHLAWEEGKVIHPLLRTRGKSVALRSSFHMGALSGDYARSRAALCCDEGDRVRFEATVSAIDTVVDEAMRGAVLRLWYGQNARDLCGLMYLLSRLDGIDCTLVDVALPTRRSLLRGGARSARSWGQLPLRHIARSLSRVSLFSDEKRRATVERWRVLEAEDALLRICRGKGLKGVQSTDLEAFKRAAAPFYRSYKQRFPLTELVTRLWEKGDPAMFYDLDITELSSLLYRLIEEGELEDLGRRTSVFDFDRWLCDPSKNKSRKYDRFCQ